MGCARSLIRLLDNAMAVTEMHKVLRWWADMSSQPLHRLQSSTPLKDNLPT